MAKGLEKKVYIICPVRNITKEEKEFLDKYVRNLENQGYGVHYPPRDVDQNDETGYNIMATHRTAMNWCTEVRAYWNPSSSGSIGDLCMAFMAEKPFMIINQKEIGEWLKKYPGKSHTNFAYTIDKLFSKKKKK